MEYGVAISALSEATVAMRTRTSPSGRGLPEIEPNGPLQSLLIEVSGFRQHMAAMLLSWEKDNQLVYFEKVSNCAVSIFWKEFMPPLLFGVLSLIGCLHIPTGTTISPSKQGLESNPTKESR